ncbi:hypothetical protein OEZ85_006728 [Tetradesmus obliquus]|uniref:Peptidase M43 pregnancy-associated plasma-A domain-containing protein n=1 Tax=Tetradesmus obliquus TaxID=3088 RepID=A0ABY8TXM1_TETOB|nr:hypothetical protein OEZ85_006728 [Tetradesmus obliquus]
MVQQETIGLVLAISSSAFIGSSFIIKKRGLRAAGAAGIRAGAGGFGYLREPIWWAGLLSMVVGELANFAAYAFAPAILVTPLGALSIIISAVLAHIFLKEQLNMFGILGCILCITGSIAIVLHAPAEKPIESVQQVWNLAMQPGFLLYSVVAVGLILWLIFWVAPEQGQSNVLVYLGICSLAGSFTVTSCKALGVALKLTFQGDNQMVYIHFYLFLLIVVTCLLTQMNYLNKALDLFNTAIVSPIYYVMFTLLTIVASVIMFQDEQTRVQMATQACGFVTIVSGTFLLHTTKDLDLTRVQLEDMVRSSSNAADDLAAGTGGSASVGARSVRERRGGGGGGSRMEMQGSSIEMGKGSQGIEVKVEAGEKGGGGGGGDQQSREAQGLAHMQKAVLLTLLLCSAAVRAQPDTAAAAAEAGSQRASTPTNPGCTTPSCSACRPGYGCGVRGRGSQQTCKQVCAQCPSGDTSRSGAANSTWCVKAPGKCAGLCGQANIAQRAGPACSCDWWAQNVGDACDASKDAACPDFGPRLNKAIIASCRTNFNAVYCTDAARTVCTGNEYGTSNVWEQVNMVNDKFARTGIQFDWDGKMQVLYVNNPNMNTYNCQSGSCKECTVNRAGDTAVNVMTTPTYIDGYAVGQAMYPWFRKLDAPNMPACADWIQVMWSSLPGLGARSSIDNGLMDGGGVLAHEIGHYLGLYHTWYQGNQFTPAQEQCSESASLNVNSITSSLSDGVRDTPAISLNYTGDGKIIRFVNCSMYEYTNTSALAQQSCTSASPAFFPQGDRYYNPYFNLMSYGDKTCIRVITPGQAARMRCSHRCFRLGNCNL